MRELRNDRRSAQNAQQASLFQPVSPPRPTWASLPPEVQQTVTELLVRILKEARERSAFTPAAKSTATRGDADE